MSTEPAIIRTPAWMVLDAMAQAAVDVHWQPYTQTFDMTVEQWAEAKEGHFAAMRDDMVEALWEMERKGWVVPLDWDVDPPCEAFVDDERTRRCARCGWWSSTHNGSSEVSS